MKKTANYVLGFTLVETLIAVLLVGIAIASLLGASSVLTQANGAAMNLSTAEFLIEQIRELTTGLGIVDPESGTSVFGPEEAGLSDYDDLDDFDDADFAPPISAERNLLNNLTGFSQQITVENVNASDFTLVVADHGSPFVRITTTIEFNGTPISSARWIRTRY